MKRLLLPLLAALTLPTAVNSEEFFPSCRGSSTKYPSGCRYNPKYSSKKKAYEACQEWTKEDVFASNGMTYEFLGFEYERSCNDLVKGEILGMQQDMNTLDIELIKTFAY